MAARLGRPPPHPRLGSVVELGGGHLHGSFNLIGEGCALARERIAVEQAPPPLLYIQPTGTFGNVHVLDAWVICQPAGAGFQAAMTAQIVSDDENVARRIVGFDVGKPRDVVRRVA